VDQAWAGPRPGRAEHAGRVGPYSKCSGINVGEGEGAMQRYDAEGATSGKGRERHSGAARRERPRGRGGSCAWLGEHMRGGHSGGGACAGAVEDFTKRSTR
jgi:hypothetical protein